MRFRKATESAAFLIYYQFFRQKLYIRNTNPETMKQYPLMIMLYLSGTILALLGVLLKIQHYNYSEPLMLAGILAAVAFIAMAVVDVWNRKEGALWQRILWTIGLLSSSSIVGLFYLLNTRKYSRRSL